MTIESTMFKRSQKEEQRQEDSNSQLPIWMQMQPFNRMVCQDTSNGIQSFDHLLFATQLQFNHRRYSWATWKKRRSNGIQEIDSRNFPGFFKGFIATEKNYLRRLS